MSITARLTELGIDLPQPAAAVANYVPFVRTGNLVHISGQLSNDASGGLKGTVGEDVTPEQANAGARL
ncbi:MAG: RidA family protein, partial [Pseudomonadota bacterium]